MIVWIAALPRRVLLIAAGAVVILYAAGSWMLFVAPTRSDAAAAEADLAAAELRLVEAEAAANRPRGTAAPVADVFRLARAMPGSADQPGLVLELSRLAERSGVKLRSITPGTQVTASGGPTLIPVTVAIGGSYAEVTKFLERTRRLVSVRNGKIVARGRLLSVRGVTIVESVTDGFPSIDASISIDAYVYDGPIVPAEVPQPDPDPAANGSNAIGGTD